MARQGTLRTEVALHDEGESRRYAPFCLRCRSGSSVGGSKAAGLGWAGLEWTDWVWAWVLSGWVAEGKNRGVSRKKQWWDRRFDRGGDGGRKG